MPALLVNQSMATDPTVGTKSGSTAWDAGGYLILNPATNFTTGRYYFNGNLQQSIDMTCDFFAGGGTGADACWFYWAGTSDAAQEDTGAAQYAVVLNEFADQIQIRYNGANVLTAAFANLDNSTYRTCRVLVFGREIKVWIDGALVLTLNDVARVVTGTFYGWGARSGGTNNEHRVRNIVMYSPLFTTFGGPLNPNALRPAAFSPGIAR